MSQFRWIRVRVLRALRARAQSLSPSTTRPSSANSGQVTSHPSAEALGDASLYLVRVETPPSERRREKKNGKEGDDAPEQQGGRRRKSREWRRAAALTLLPPSATSLPTSEERNRIMSLRGRARCGCTLSRDFWFAAVSRRGRRS